MDFFIKVVIDDVWYYVKIIFKKYDIVIFDIFFSEVVFEYLIIVEGFVDIKKIMNFNGMIMINFYGFIEGEKGLVVRLVYKIF